VKLFISQKLHSSVEGMRLAVRWMMIKDQDPQQSVAQCKALSSQIPLIYALIMINTLAAAIAYSDVAPASLTVWALAPIWLLAGIRLKAWIRISREEITPDQAVRKLRSVVSLGAFIGVVFSVWATALGSFASVYEQSDLALIGVTTMIACIFSLSQLPQAALMVTLIISVPYLIHSLSLGQDIQPSILLNFFLICLVSLKAILNAYKAFIGQIRSQQALEIKQRENERLSRIDFLTGMPNRRAFFADLDRQLKSDPAGQEFSVGVIDLDQFKPINDTYGHKIGDKVLNAVGARILAFERQELKLCRLGGDEFGFLYTGSQEAAVELANAICQEIRKPIQAGELHLAVGASCGIASYPDGGTTPHDLFDHSDYALYHSKTKLRGSVTVYSSDHAAQIHADRAIESALQRADITKEFEVHFQPIVSMPTKEITGFEALARWHSPELGHVAPNVFIQVAERTGHMQRLTVELFAMAVKQLNALPGNLKLSFNLSVQDLAAEDTIKSLLRIINGHRIDPTRIIFEITETSLISNIDLAHSHLRILKDAGCKLALDDFGTGYSSLGYLHRLPIDRVKIDRSFVSSIDEQAAVGVVSAVLQLCRSMQLTCVVEGVETEAQLARLEDLGCTLFQGYLFCPPKSFTELRAGLRAHGTINGLKLSSNTARPEVLKSA